VLAAPTPAEPAQIAKAREALEARMQQLAAQPLPEPDYTLGGPPGKKPGKKSVTEQVLESFPPLQPPPPAISAAKRQRLDDLLARYKADQITPEQYHEQRAKILAEP
jgi:hypothetical protein